MIDNPSIWAALKDKVNNGIFDLVGTGRPTNGTSGTGVSLLAAYGSTYVNLTNGRRYVNTNTGASPFWECYSGLKYGVATYSFATDGGAVSTITPGATVNYEFPSGAIIIGGVLDITTTFTSGGSATLAIGTSAGSSASAILGATAVASLTAGRLAIVPVFTAATMVKLTAAGSVTFTIATAAMTAGVVNLHLLYF